MLSKTPFTAPVFAAQTDLTMLESINMAYFDDSTGISSAFSLPKHYAIAARVNWVALNGPWQDGQLSNSFQLLAADSIIKIIKTEGGRESKGERGKVQLQFLSSGHTRRHTFPTGLFTLSL